MHDAKEFLATIHEREMAILDAAIPDHS
jgi:hypothetical protein